MGLLMARFHPPKEPEIEGSPLKPAVQHRNNLQVVILEKAGLQDDHGLQPNAGPPKRVQMAKERERKKS